MPLAVLGHTGRVAAEATLERLAELGIEAEIIDQPNVFVRLTSGGNYRVRVVVQEEDLERGRAELARWEAEAAPRVAALSSEVLRVLLLTAVPPLGLAGWLITREPVPHWSLAAIFGFWLGALAAWVLWSRLRRVPPGPERGPEGRFEELPGE